MNRPAPNNSKVPLRCPSCGVSRNAGKRCEYCGSVYADGLHLYAHDIYDGLLDRKYKVKKDGRDVEITWRWRKPIHFALLASSVTWGLIATFVMVLMLIYEDYTDPFDIMWRPLAHIIPMILVACYSGLYFCNRSTIAANPEVLSLAHHPIKWPGGVKIAADDVTDIVVERREKSGKGEIWDVPVLAIIGKGGRRSTLMKGALEEEFRDFRALRYFLLTALGREHD